MFYFPINIGFLIIPIDEVIFFRGLALAHQPAKLCPTAVSIPLMMQKSPIPRHPMASNAAVEAEATIRSLRSLRPKIVDHLFFKSGSESHRVT